MREESSTPVLRLFGREPTVVDLRCVGRWSYAAAWVAQDRATAREIVRTRLELAAAAATRAAMGAGRGDAERFMLVSALARLNEAAKSGTGALGAAVERAVDETAAQLAEEGLALRMATSRERAAFVPRFGLESFATAMLDVGQERNVLMREASDSLEEALVGMRNPCPALRTLRLFLLATLSVESHDASAVLAPPCAGEIDVVARLGVWLTADLALAARRATAYEAAWAAAARSSGDALSKTIAGLTSGSMQTKGVADALREDPWVLPWTLAMTVEPAHASALLDCGVQAQIMNRVHARQEVTVWADQARGVDDLESSLGISVLASHEAREGYRECESCGGLDLFSSWAIARTAEEAQIHLRRSIDRSTAAEGSRRREAVRRAKNALQGLRDAYEAAIEAARMSGETPVEDLTPLANAEAGAHRGCVFGFGAGCSVMATYAALGAVVGTEGFLGQVAPLVSGVAALPIAAAILAQIAVGVRRASATSEANRRREAASAEMERLRSDAERSQGNSLAQGREVLEAAESSLAAFERRLSLGSGAT